MSGQVEFVGVDGCKGGWFSVGLDRGGEWELEVFKTFDQLLKHYREVKLVLVDIPIGLKEGGTKERSCDKEARALLGRPRGSSVFRTPTRQAASQATYPAAVGVERDLIGKGMSKQSFAIAGKITEVDKVMLARSARATQRVREVHPEVCFWALNGKQAMRHGKRTEEGREERIAVLGEVEPKTQEIFDEAGSKFLRRDVAKDDILDALVAAVTAREGSLRGALRTIPPNPPMDSKGLPMEMVYWGKDLEVGT